MEATENMIEEQPLQLENALLAGQKRVLELIATGAPLDETLAELTRFIEAQEEGLRCNILVLSDDGEHFRHGTGPALPEAYHEALDGISILPPYFSPCSQAAHQAVAVAVPDIAEDTRWDAAWRGQALAAGLAACRSTPVCNSDGRVLASFVIYYDEPRDPQPAYPELIEIATHLACIAIERERSRWDAVLRESERQSNVLLDVLPVAVYKTDATGKVTYYNKAAVRLAGREPELGKDEWCVSWHLYYPDGSPMRHDECPMAIALRENRPILGGEAAAERPDGTRVPFLAYPVPLRDPSGALIGAVNTMVDISHRKLGEETRQQLTDRLQALQNVSKLLSGDLDLDRIIQAVTDCATQLSGAQFGAFFYNAVDEKGEHFRLHSLSGMPREAFERFGTPRNTSMFGTTFRGEGIVRSADVREDPRYGHNPPYHGIPEGHPPVASYLAVPVISRTGDVIGGLFLGHGKTGVFGEDTEDLIAGIVAHAAIAIDNARLFEAAQNEIERSQRVEHAAQQLAAIVESSDDAIVSKDLNAIIQTWNKGAESLFGYTAEEVIGKPVTILIPPNREDEEPYILSRIRRGQSVDHYDTIRQRKDGRMIDISLTVSPIRDSNGKIIGASKIARDISDRRTAERHRELLLHELSHRVKNSLATVQSIALQTLHHTSSSKEFRDVFLARLVALAHTHDLLMRTNWQGASLSDLVTLELAPYQGDETPRWSADGSVINVNAKTALALGMALHELATNAAKYGALSGLSGTVQVQWQTKRKSNGGEMLCLNWIERGGPQVSKPQRRGFGSRLIKQGLKHELRADVTLEFEAAGLVCTICVPLADAQAVHGVEAQA